MTERPDPATTWTARANAVAPVYLEPPCLKCAARLFPQEQRLSVRTAEPGEAEAAMAERWERERASAAEPPPA